MSKGEKAVIGLLVIGFVATNFVIATVTKPVVKTQDVVRTVFVTPTASPSATVVPLRTIRGASVTNSVTKASVK